MPAAVLSQSLCVEGSCVVIRTSLPNDCSCGVAPGVVCFRDKRRLRPLSVERFSHLLHLCDHNHTTLPTALNDTLKCVIYEAVIAVAV